MIEFKSRDGKMNPADESLSGKEAEAENRFEESGFATSNRNEGSFCVVAWLGSLKCNSHALPCNRRGEHDFPSKRQSEES